jgi:putative SOS response-associated peptidase YedK
MCGRFGLALSGEDLAELLDLDDVLHLEPDHNITPGRTLTALRQTESTAQIAELKWGLVPFWAKDRKIGNRLINARSETVAEKPSFRNAFRKRRCLIPTDGFYEWRKEGKRTQPYHIGLKNGRGFCMAGLWEHWMNKETGEVIESCTVLTTEANPLIAPIHGRMPVILPRQMHDTWLTPNTLLPLDMFKPYSADKMETWPVSTLVNSPANRGASCRTPQGILL